MFFDSGTPKELSHILQGRSNRDGRVDPDPNSDLSLSLILILLSHNLPPEVQCHRSFSMSGVERGPVTTEDSCLIFHGQASFV